MALTEIPIELSSTPSIVDGGNATAITISSAELVTVANGLTLTDGNVVVANGHGIDFSATSGSGTSELLSDYEEGTWTPTFSVSSGAVEIFSARYTKIGRQVIVNLSMRVTSTVSAGERSLTFSGPFTQFTAGATDIGVVSVYPDGNNNNAGIVLNSSSGNTTDFAMVFTLAASFGAGSSINAKLVYETNQ